MVKNRPSVSVIIPAYNSAQYLPESIESVLDQSLQDYEIIVVDDGSTDNTTEVLKPYASKIRVLMQNNRGPGAARNAGIGACSGEYLVFLDADDILFRDKFQVQAAFLDQHPEIGVVFSDVVCFFNKDGSEVTRPFPTSMHTKRALGSPEKTLEILAIQNILPPLSAMARRSCVESVDGFDESKELVGLEDWDLWFRIAQRYDFAYLDEIAGKYRVISSSISQNKPGMKRASCLMELKFESSEAIKMLPRSVRSDFYFCWGVQWLDYGEPELAINRFRKAREVDASNFMAGAAFVLTKLMGKRAISFYHWKRKTLGVRGNFRSVVNLFGS